MCKLLHFCELITLVRLILDFFIYMIYDIYDHMILFIQLDNNFDPLFNNLLT